jgi:MFS family permease
VTIASMPSETTPSRWGPFSHVAFTVIWSVSVVSNIGTAMFDTASGWLITSIDPNPMMVSLVQVAVSLPLFLFTLPAGALADVLDSRRLLIAVETAILTVSVIFAGLVSVGLATPTLLLATTFLLGIGGALTSPAWGATLPMLVSKEDLDGATAANGAGFNIGRAAGPALGGLVIAWSRISVPFWVFAATNVAIIAALLWWRSPRRAGGSLPAERLLNAVRTGARHAANNPDLRATLLARLWTQSGPPDDDSGEHYGCGKVGCELVIAGGDASLILEAAEHALDEIALAISGLVERMMSFAGRVVRDQTPRERGVGPTTIFAECRLVAQS